MRPEHVTVGEAGEGGEPGEVLAVEPLGAETHLVVRVGGHELRAQARGFATFGRGDAVRVSVRAERSLVFDADAEGARVG